MTTDDKIRDKRQQFDFSRKVAKTSVLLSGKIDKYGELKGEYILTF